MRHVRPRYAPSLPLLSHFLELNLRTYVKDPRNGQGGVYFFSLDCSNPIAVEIACKAYHLPYYNALMKMSKSADQNQSEEVHYQSVRIHADSATRVKEPQRQVSGDIYAGRQSLLQRAKISRGFFDRALLPASRV